MNRLGTAKGSGLATALLGFALAGAGCNPGVFGDLEDATWVVSSGAPSGTGSNGFGLGLVAVVPVAQADGFQVAGLAQNPAAIGTVTASLSGEISGNGAPIAIGGESAVLPNASPFAAAPAAVAGVTGGLVAVGLPTLEFNNITGAVTLHDAAAVAPERAAFTTPDMSIVGFGRALAITDAAGDGSTLDLVVASDTTLFLRQDIGGVTGINPAGGLESCVIGSTAVLGLVAADLNGAAGDEILVVIDDGGDPQIVVLDAATISAAHADMGNPDCFDAGVRDPLAAFDAFSAAADFGFASAVGDFDGDGSDDVALSAPSTNEVFLWQDIDLGNPPASLAALPAGSGASSFGFALAAGDIDGDGNDDLAVGDPARSVDGEEAGDVTVFLGGNSTDTVTLADAEPDGGQRFGQSLVIAPFFASGSVVRGALVGEAGVRK